MHTQRDMQGRMETRMLDTKPMRHLLPKSRNTFSHTSAVDWISVPGISKRVYE